LDLEILGRSKEKRVNMREGEGIANVGIVRGKRDYLLRGDRGDQSSS